MSINSVGTESVNQTGQAGKTECLVGRPYSQDTCETQLSPYGLTLRISVMCKAHASFHGMLSHELPAKSLQSSVAWVFILSLSNTQPLQWNSTINTGYKRLNNITIKFGETQLSPSGLTLCILVMCKAYASFRRMLSCELPAKSLQSSVAWVFILSLSNKQSLHWNSTISTWYKKIE